jgi:hypothetical protein
MEYFNLSSTNIGRFDYYYFRPITYAHTDDKLKYFMQSCDKILSKYKRRKAILVVCAMSQELVPDKFYYYRIYQNKTRCEI